MKKIILFSLLILSGGFVRANKKILFDPPQPMIVTADIADVRTEPVKRNSKYEFDPLQETQVLKGERVMVLEQRGKWSRIQCPSQLEFSHNVLWEGYPGWIETKNLSADTSLEKKISAPTNFDNELRWQILSEAKRHLGSPYLWGGLSVHDPKNKKILSGVDCSGLVNWAYRQVGWLIPRDAHEQSMLARKIGANELKPADLIFLAKPDKPEKVVHVVIYMGDGKIIEAPQSGERVREMTFEKRFGKFLTTVSSGTVLADRVITFGTYFPEAPHE